MSADSATTARYRGSEKHKNRPAVGAKGTLCPEWTHMAPDRGLGSDMFDHDWPATEAARLFAASEVDPADGHRYATARGVAFTAKLTENGTWHGYPIGWEAVPHDLKRAWKRENRVRAQDLRKWSGFTKEQISWALDTDPK